MIHDQSTNNHHNPHATVTTTTKRRKLSDDHHSLLPGLPDHIAQICLSLIPPSSLYSVCRSWRRLIYSLSFPPFRSLYILSLPTTTTVDGGQIVKLLSFDPISSKWTTVDSPPLPPYLRHVSLRHPSFMSWSFPIQSVSVSGNLILIAGTSIHRSLPVPAFTYPLLFNPLSNMWISCPSLSTPRRWCAAGALNDTVVVASGIGSHYTETVARSVEKWVVRKNVSFDEKMKSWKHLEIKDESLKHLRLKNESFDEKMQSLKHLEIKDESFDENMKPWKHLEINNESFDEKMQSLNLLEIKDESFDEKIESFNHLEIYNESFDEKMQSLNHLKLKDESFDEKIQSLNHLELTNESLDEKMQSLNNLKLKDESFDEKIQSLNNLKLKLKDESFAEKMQSLNHLKLKLKDESFAEKMQSLNHLKLKTESLDENSYGYCEKIQSLNHLKQKSKPFDGKWKKMQSLKHSKLCREAIEAVGWKGKLCMVNVKGNYAKEGFVYNLDSDEWTEMPEGMLGGWRGPTAAMDEDTMYVVDESRGVLRRYNEDNDCWLEVVVDERLKGAEYMAAGGGRVCVVGENTVGIVVVDVVAVVPRLWVVETPVGYDVLGIHILPRMCWPDV